ncbi:putative arsenite-translocating ATPase, partial [Pseudoloma neurophilia]
QPINEGITEITPFIDVLEVRKEKIVFKESNLQPVLNSILELPGIREAIFISKIIEKSKDYKHVVIDTWPSFSFLNFLFFPDELSTLLNKIANLDQCNELKQTEFYEKMMKINSVIEKSEIVQNSSFILVCVPEGFSLEEISLMIDQLNLYDISIDNLVINQILQRKSECVNCNAIIIRQEQVLKKLRKLNLRKIEIDFIPEGIKGLEQLKKFSKEFL